jgi:hypothetical protein
MKPQAKLAPEGYEEWSADLSRQMEADREDLEKKVSGERPIIAWRRHLINPIDRPAKGAALAFLNMAHPRLSYDPIRRLPGWSVESMSKRGVRYVVEPDGRCECPDSMYRSENGVACKHSWATVGERAAVFIVWIRDCHSLRELEELRGWDFKNCPERFRAAAWAEFEDRAAFLRMQENAIDDPWARFCETLNAANRAMQQIHGRATL